MLKTYKLFQGESITDTITVTLPPQLRNLVETQCRDAWRQLHSLPTNDGSASPFLTYEQLTKTVEGREHLRWLRLGFYIRNVIPGYPIQPYAKSVTMEEYNAILARIHARRYNTQGTRRRFEKRVHSATDYRKFRSWWLSGHIAQALGTEFSEPCPYKPIDSGVTESYIEMGYHFEEWTGYKLPKPLWDEIRQDEKERLAKLAEPHIEQVAA